MKYYIINHVGYLYLVSHDCLKIASKAKVNVNQKVKFQDGTKFKEGTIVFVGADKKCAENELIRRGKSRPCKTEAPTSSPLPHPQDLPATRSTRGSVVTPSAASSSKSIPKTSKRKCKQKRHVKKKKEMAEREMETETEEKSPTTITDDDASHSSIAELSEESDFDSASGDKIVFKSGHQRLKEIMSSSENMALSVSDKSNDEKPLKLTTQTKGNGSDTETSEKKTGRDSANVQKKNMWASESTSQVTKRNNCVFTGTNYLYDESSEGVVKLHANYNIYVKRVDLDMALSKSKSSTTFIRQLAPKIYTKEAMIEATPQGYMARGKGKESYLNTTPLPRMDPDGIEALIQRATDEEESTKKIWRPRSTAAEKRKAFSVIVSTIKKEAISDQDYLFT